MIFQDITLEGLGLLFALGAILFVVFGEGFREIAILFAQYSCG